MAVMSRFALSDSRRPYFAITIDHAGRQLADFTGPATKKQLKANHIRDCPRKVLERYIDHIDRHR